MRDLSSSPITRPTCGSRTPKGRALIVPVGDQAQAGLVHSAGIWIRIARSLSVGNTVTNAVNDGNTWAASQNWALRFQVVGGAHVRIR